MAVKLEELKTLLEYCPKTGIFTWRVRVSRAVDAGSAAGTIVGHGYISIGIRRRYYTAHRLAWLYTHGVWPRELDHINGIRTDNRITNLREVTRSENRRNSCRPTTNTSGYKGVTWYAPTKRWQARCTVAGTRHSLGYFETPEAAGEAYAVFARANHGEFYRKPEDQRE